MMERQILRNGEIVSSNLKKKTSWRSKLSYLLFAYQGVIITSVLVILFGAGLAYAFISQKDAVLTVRVLSKDVSYENVVTQLQDKYSGLIQPDDKQTIDVQNLDLAKEQNQDVLVAQLAGHDVDLLILTETMDEEMKPLFEKNQIKRGAYSYTDLAGRYFVSRIPGKIPNEENLMKVIRE